MVCFREPVLSFELQRHETEVLREEGKGTHLVVQMFDVFFDRIDELCLILLNCSSNLQK